MAHIRNFLNYLLSFVRHTLIANRRLKTWEMDQHLIKLFDKHNIDCVIDVGANRGQYCEYLRANPCYKGLVVSFEPIPENLTVLKEKSKQDCNWVIYGCALGKESGEKEFNIMEATGFSSFYHPAHEGAQSLVNKNKIARTEFVKIERLDKFLPKILEKYNVSNIFLKMDTQGYDVEVLEGLGNSYSELRAIQTEVPVLKLYQEAPTFIESINYLLSKNYFISGLFPVNRDRNLRVYDIDCIMVNGRYCDQSV